jgi:hypothetical protein
MPNVTFNFRAQGAESVRREIQRTLDATKQGLRAVQGQSQQAAQRSATAEQQATQATLTESAKRTKAKQKEAQAVAAAERTATAAVASEEAKRSSAHATGIRARIRGVMEYVRAAVSGEQQVSREQQREQRRRANAWGQRASSAVTGAIGVGSTLHSQIQDAQQRRATSERNAEIAFRGGGATISETRDRVARLQAFARENRMSFDDLATAAQASQGQFSTLQGSNEQERGAALERFLSAALFARNSGNNVAEVTRLQGFFAQQNFSSSTQDALLRFAAGAANRGSVELGNMTREALMPITQRINTAQSQLGPGATQAQRDQVAVDTFRQSVAELQVEALGGASARRSGMALSSAAQFLADPSRQSKMLTNIQNAHSINDQQRRALIGALFQTDRQGNRTLRSTNPLEVVESFQRVIGNNPLALQNIFAGGGRSNPQSLLVNQRNALAQLMSLDGDARSRVRGLMDPSVSLTEEDLRQGADLYGNDRLARLTGNEETRLSALTDNTSALTRLSDALSNFQASNPILSTAGGTAAGALASGGAGLLAGKLGGTALAGTAMSGLAAIAPWVAGGLGAAAAGVGVGEAFNRNVVQGDYDYSGIRTANGGSMEGVRVRRVGSAAPTDSILSGDTWREIGRMIGLGFTSSAQSPQAAMHAASSLGTANGPPPEQRVNR